jgi:hypothetical protein
MKYRTKGYEELDAFLWTGGIDQEDDPEWFLPFIERKEIVFIDSFMVISRKTKIENISKDGRTERSFYTKRGALAYIGPGEKYFFRKPNDSKVYAMDKEDFESRYERVVFEE